MDINYYIDAPITQLNSDTLADVLTMCRNYPRYRACVIFDSSGNYIPFINKLMNENRTTPIPGTHLIRFYETHAMVEFENGSIIDLFILGKNSRGKEYNTILCTEGIDDIFSSILLPMLIRYDESTILHNEVNKNGVHNEDDESVLDDFLKSFVIKS